MHHTTYKNAPNPMKNKLPDARRAPGGTNLDDKGMPDRFQAFPGVQTGLKQPQMIDFRVNKISNKCFFTKWLQNRPFDLIYPDSCWKFHGESHGISQKIK